MSLSSANLSAILSVNRPLSSEDATRLRQKWLQYTVLGPGEQVDLADLIRDGQERLKARPAIEYRPALRVPFPFNLGPNGSLLLLGSMLVAVAGLVCTLAALGALP